MSVRQVIAATSFLLFLTAFSIVTRDLAVAEERWPPWQSYSEAEEAERQKALRRKAAAANELASLKRQIEQLKSAGKYPQAVQVAQRLLALTEKRGAQSLAVADVLDTLAGLYEAQSKFAEAEPLLKRSLAIREKAPGQPGVVAARERLAAVYDREGKTAEAEALRSASGVPSKEDTKRTADTAKKPTAAPTASGDEAPFSIPPADAPSADAPSAGEGADNADNEAGRRAAVAEKARQMSKVEEELRHAEAARQAGNSAGAKQPGDTNMGGLEEPAPSSARHAESVPGSGPVVIPPAASPAPAAREGGAPPMPPAAIQPSPSEPPVEAPASAPQADRDTAEAPAAKAELPEFGARAMHHHSRSARAAPPPPPAETAPETAAPAMPDTASEASAPAGAGSDAPPQAVAEPMPAPAAPASGGAAAPANADWQVVPVYWGTDRAVQPNAQRLAFGSDRARKLQLGLAQISVPKVHQVPNVERPWVVKIPYFDVTLYAEAEDPKKHFTIKEIKALTKDELLAQVKARLGASKTFKDQALVFVHGYNTSFDNALYRTAQIAYDLDFDGAPFLYSWPSGGAVASYTYDRESAQASEPYLRQFLEMVAKETGAKQVSIIAHSMGNQPLMDVLRDLKAATPEGVIISQVILAAPDVDADGFSNLAKAISGLANNVTLYVAANDRALIVSRNFWGSYRAGDVPPSGPLVLPGIDTIDVTAASTDVFAINHSGYAANNKLLADVGELLRTGLRPPELRALKPDKVSSQAGDYWRYVPAPQ